MNTKPPFTTDHDDRLSSVYRELEPALPPAALDDAILAAAHRATGARPRAAGAPFVRRWQAPLSIAAVVVLCVSLVAVMRDEGGELTRVPAAEGTLAAARDTLNDSSVVSKPDLVPEMRSNNIGLKLPSAGSGEPAGGLDQYALSTPATTAGKRPSIGLRPAEKIPGVEPDARDSAQSGSAVKKESAATGFAESPPPIVARAQARRDAPAEAERSPMVAATEGRARAVAGNVAAPAAPSIGATAAISGTLSQRQDSAVADRSEPDGARARTSADAQLPARPASAPLVAESAVQSKSAAAPARVLQPAASVMSKDSAVEVARMAGLTPEKWLERIDELRRMGRTEDARAGLEAFRQRFPGYELPAGLREWSAR